MNYIGYVETGGVATFRRATRSSPRSFAELKARAACRSAPATSPRRTTSGTRSAQFFTQQAQSEGSMTELEEYAAAHRGARAAARARLLPGRLRGGAGELHDRDRGLRPAGAHAALVVRRALHPPARAAAHGALADLRGHVPGQPVPRLPGGQQLARREHAGHRARARPRRLREEQPAVRALPGHGRRQHRRAGRRARAPHPAGDRGRTGSSASKRCSTRRSRSKRTSTSTSELRRARYPEFAASEAAAPTQTDVPEALRAAARRGGAADAADRAQRAPRAAAPRVRPALVHRAVRARARAVGARHLPRGARGVVLLLPGVRLPDHERGLGVVLARAAAARGGLPAADAVPRRDQGALGRGAAVRRGQQPALAINPYHLGFSHLGAHRREARPRARARSSCARRTTSASSATT